MDLLAFERKLDQTIMRKRLDIQEALKRPIKVPGEYQRVTGGSQDAPPSLGRKPKGTAHLSLAFKLHLSLLPANQELHQEHRSGAAGKERGGWQGEGGLPTLFSRNTPCPCFCSSLPWEPATLHDFVSLAPWHIYSGPSQGLFAPQWSPYPSTKPAW